MSLNSKIEWTEATWNPITGCTKISIGCENCYAERLCYRLKAMENEKYRNGFKPTIHPEALNEPLKWKTPKKVFVVSMGDIFHEDVPDDFIQEIFKVMNKSSMHIFQVLTKRSERYFKIMNNVEWSSNIWAGVTVEHSKYLHRLDDLRKVPSKVRFISFEPLLSDIPEISFKGIDWIIVGGESGPRSRKIDPSWVRNIKDQCLKQDTPFFFKQWGGFNKKKNGRKLDGKTWSEMPISISY